MRVATISIYKQATYQLGRLTSDLNEANEVVSTNLKVSSASDDPSGMKQVLTINSDLAALEQYQVNVDQAQNVLTTAETALDSMADQLSEMKLLCSALSNASASYQERSNAAESMSVYLDGLLDLANTDAYGGYVFGGDDNRTTPFTYDDDDNPTRVTYNGSSDPVNISTSRNTNISLDCCGSDLFYEDEIIVDATNNKIVFTEDPGTGDDNIITIEATITSGTYSKEELAAIVEDTMNEASKGVVYEVEYDGDTNTFSIGTDGSNDKPMRVTFEAIQTETVRISNLETNGSNFEDVKINILHETALTEYTPVPEGTKPLTFTYNGADGTWEVSNDPGYGLPSEIEATGNTLEIDLNDDGEPDITVDLNGAPEDEDTVSFDIVEGYENASVLPDLGFESETVVLETVTSDFEVANTFSVGAGNDTIDFTETLLDGGGTSVQLTAVIEAGIYSNSDSYAEAVEEALESASAENGNRVNYSVVYDAETNSFTLSENTKTGRQLESFDLLFSSGTNASDSAASSLGFNADKDVSSAPQKGKETTWSIWDTIFDLKKALENDDVDGIQRAMSRLDNHYESLTSSISTVGRIYGSTTTTEATISDSDLTLTTQRSTVRDADIVEAIMDLKSAQTVYQAALSSTSSVMGLSLVDYMS
ncbi:MAG: flagellar hook-associated protein 3 [Desulfobacter postgatei]|uniref:flagellin N-terminal helical domain-containing protein n=1 Tax=Desulfobacter postgatei TaxID=2293 RepID=UPI0023F3CA5A|nr:flagellar hook-associated protein 3 [Desulfobacter postgatei]MDD4273761.1 flagellar hook-associated protein 3 [Desulfobacter postgatei]